MAQAMDCKLAPYRKLLGERPCLRASHKRTHVCSSNLLLSTWEGTLIGEMVKFH